MPDFNQLLHQTADSFERPKPLPIGTYTFTILGHEMGESRQKKTPFVQFNVQPTAASADVDETLLDSITEWQARKMRHTFYITEDSLFRLTEFMGHLGLGVDRPLDELIPEATGFTFLGTVTQRASNTDPNSVFNDISSTAPVEG